MSAIFGFTFDIGRMTEVLTPDIYRAHCLVPIVESYIYTIAKSHLPFQTTAADGDSWFMPDSDTVMTHYHEKC